MRIVFVQYGDYREAFRRLERGGEETYGGQRYSVDLVARLVERGEEVVVACLAAEAYEEELAPGLRALGCRLYGDTTERELARRVAGLRPDRLVLRTPVPALLRWANRSRVRTLALLATSFRQGGLRRTLRSRRVAPRLDHPSVEWVANHQLNSARDLARIGVAPSKIVPWDWPPSSHPEDFLPKEGAPSAAPRLFFAGRVSAAKGVGDAITTVAALRARSLPAELTVAGSGELAGFRELAERLGVGPAVHFLGAIPNRKVVEAMHEHDLVLVPSRHAYPEGLPLTIYDAFCSRTPLVASDHPMFRDKVVDGESGVVFRAGEPEDMARRILGLLEDGALYRRLSAASAEAWRRLQLETTWGDVLLRWLADDAEGRDWLRTRTLAALEGSG